MAAIGNEYTHKTFSTYMLPVNVNIYKLSDMLSVKSLSHWTTLIGWNDYMKNVPRCTFQKYPYVFYIYRMADISKGCSVFS